MIDLIRHSPEYRLITEVYGDSIAARSKLPLMNHINEGIQLLLWQHQDLETILAFCIHPCVQADDMLAKYAREVYETCRPASIMYAMEYRSVANEYLSHRDLTDHSQIRLSPLEQVNWMLWADKVQNFKDFQSHHINTHPRAAELTDYFINWHMRLQSHLTSMGQLNALHDVERLHQEGTPWTTQ